MKLDLDLTPKQTESLKKMLKKGFIYQRFQHTCGFVGNSYHKVNDKWEKRTVCPQCDETLTWIKFKDWMREQVKKFNEDF